MSESQAKLIMEAKHAESLFQLQLLLTCFGNDESCRLTIQRSAYELIESFVSKGDLHKIDCRDSDLLLLCGPYYRAARYLWHGALSRE